MSLTILFAIWVWFTAQVIAPPCLVTPTMEIVPSDYPMGYYTGYHSEVGELIGTVTVSDNAKPWMVIHEFAHHYDWVCRISERPVGRSFAYRQGVTNWWSDPEYDLRGSERFASNITWILAGVRAGAPVMMNRYYWLPIARHLFAFDWELDRSDGRWGEAFKEMFYRAG